MDDTDEKIRRNLVTASAAVIASAWLNVSLADIAGSFIKVPLDPLRLIGAGIAVIAYFLYRFRFTADLEKLMLGIRGQIATEQIKLADQLVDATLVAATRTQKAPSPLASDLFAAFTACEIDPLVRPAKPTFARENLQATFLAP